MVSPTIRGTSTWAVSISTGIEPTGVIAGDLLLWESIGSGNFPPSGWNLIYSGSVCKAWIIRGSTPPNYTGSGGSFKGIAITAITTGTFDPTAPIRNNSTHTTSANPAPSIAVTGTQVGDLTLTSYNDASSGTAGTTVPAGFTSYIAHRNAGSWDIEAGYNNAGSNGPFNWNNVASVTVVIDTITIAQFIPPPPVSGNLPLLGVG